MYHIAIQPPCFHAAPSFDGNQVTVRAAAKRHRHDLDTYPLVAKLTTDQIGQLRRPVTFFIKIEVAAGGPDIHPVADIDIVMQEVRNEAGWNAFSPRRRRLTLDRNAVFVIIAGPGRQAVLPDDRLLLPIHMKLEGQKLAGSVGGQRRAIPGRKVK